MWALFLRLVAVTLVAVTLVAVVPASASGSAALAGDGDPEVLQVTAVPAPVTNAPRFTDDLPAIEQRGTLRVLVQGHGEDLLPRDGASSRQDRDLVEEFAARRGLSVQIVTVRAFDELLPALLSGLGDVVAGRLTVTAARKKQIAFTRPFRVVDELLVGPASAPVPSSLDAAIAQLAGRPVAVLGGSAHEETIDTLKGPRPFVARVTDDRDEHDLAAAVARLDVPATVIDSDVLAHVRAYNPDVVPWLPLRTGRELALGVRKENAKLKAALDAFLVERALTSGRTTTARLDLDGLKKRGSIRVLTKNDDVSYFLHKGTQRGFDHDLLALFAQEHRLRVDVVVPPDPSSLCAWLAEGRGDVVAALLPEPGCGAGTSSSPPYLWPDLVLLQPEPRAPRGKKARPPARVVDLDGLSGRTLHVPAGLPLSVATALTTLAAARGFTIVADAPDDVDARTDAVADGALPLSVVSSTERGGIAGRADVRADVVVVRDVPRVLATRADAPGLALALSAFVRGHVDVDDKGRVGGSTAYNLLRRAYLSPTTTTKAATTTTAASTAAAAQGTISPFDGLLQRRAAEAGLDWRLLAAQAYQESRFDPDARSDAGAVGLFQVLPSTGRELGFSNLRDPEQSVAAGAKYMAWLIEQFEPTVAFKHRVRFALASYNAGKGHVDDARRLAKKMGLDPDKWFKNVEVAMLKLADPRVARTTRYGFCRGSEPVAYVSQITTRYENYTTLVDAPSSPSSPSSSSSSPSLSTPR
jgi:membrane-bound lytic murein transglycosylase F